MNLEKDNHNVCVIVWYLICHWLFPISAFGSFRGPAARPVAAMLGTCEEALFGYPSLCSQALMIGCMTRMLFLHRCSCISVETKKISVSTQPGREGTFAQHGLGRTATPNKLFWHAKGTKRALYVCMLLLIFMLLIKIALIFAVVVESIDVLSVIESQLLLIRRDS
jgi:hypothetical protein